MIENAAALLLRKLSMFIDLTGDEEELLNRLFSEGEAVEAGAELMGEADAGHAIFLLQSGWMHRYKILPDGRRQILNFLVPGDLIGIRHVLFGLGNYSVAALTPCLVSRAAPEEVLGLFETQPRVSAAFAWSSAREEAIVAEHVVRLGRRSAYERLAHLMLELYRRLQAVGLASEATFRMPLTQETLADALGLSIVHVNRTLRKLREEGLVSVEEGEVQFHDLKGLEALGNFESAYLYKKGTPDRTERLLDLVGEDTP